MHIRIIENLIKHEAFADFMAINASDPFIIEAIGGSISKVVSTVQVLVGGLFGLYLLQFLLRWRFYRRMEKMMNEIKNSLNTLTKNYNKDKGGKK